MNANVKATTHNNSGGRRVTGFHDGVSLGGPNLSPDVLEDLWQERIW